MRFFEALFMLLFGEDGQVPDEYPGQDIPLFALGAAIVGTLVIVLDLILFRIRGRSLLNLGYAGLLPTLVVVSLWGIGAGLAGLLGAWGDVFEMGRSGCLAIGIGWPAIVPRLIESGKEIEELQQPAGDT